MEMTKTSMDYRIDMHLKEGKAKGIAINGAAIRKAQELIGLGHFIFFSPEDLGIIKNGPAERAQDFWIWSYASWTGFMCHLWLLTIKCCSKEIIF